MHLFDRTFNPVDYLSMEEEVDTMIENRDPKGYATAGVCHSRLRSPSDLWHSSVSRVTKEELSVSTRQTRDNKATKNRSMIIISLQGKGWRGTKIRVGNDKISTSLVECEHVKAKIGKALRADGSPRMWKKLPPARGQKGFLS